jgi:hypothetical protein
VTSALFRDPLWSGVERFDRLLSGCNARPEALIFGHMDALQSRKATMRRAPMHVLRSIAGARMGWRCQRGGSEVRIVPAASPKNADF